MNLNSIYPNSTPEFRILAKQNGTQELQFRYVSSSHGYIGKWQSIPVVKEEEANVINT
jgi:hypothetical protein